MTPEQVAALEQWAKQERDYATEMGCGTDYTSVNKLRDVLALCAAWREGQEQIKRLVETDTAVWCSACGDQIVNDGDDVLCWGCVANARSRMAEAEQARDATLAQLDALSDAICPEWRTKGLASVLTGLAAAHRSDSETMDEISDGFDVSYRQAVEQRNAALARCRHLENEANGRQCPTCAGPMTVDGCAECAAALARAEQAERERDEARKQRPKLVTLDRWSDAVVTALEADRSKAEATIATLRARAAQWERRARVFRRAHNDSVATHMRDVMRATVDTARLAQYREVYGPLASSDTDAATALARVRAERNSAIESRDKAIAEIATLRAALTAAQGCLAWVREQLHAGRTIRATDPNVDVLVCESDGSVRGNLTISDATVAAQADPLPALPEGWRYYPREDAWARTSHPERPGQRYASVSLNDEGVVIEGDISPADLITVLRHAEAAHQRLKEGQ